MLKYTKITPYTSRKSSPRSLEETIKIRNRILFAQTLTVFDALDQILEVEASLVLAERFQGWDFHHGAAKATENGPRSPSRCTETVPRGFATSRWQHVAPDAGTYGVYATVTGSGRCYPKAQGTHHEPPHHLCVPHPPQVSELKHPQTRLMLWGV